MLRGKNGFDQEKFGKSQEIFAVQWQNFENRLAGSAFYRGIQRLSMESRLPDQAGLSILTDLDLRQPALPNAPRLGGRSFWGAGSQPGWNGPSRHAIGQMAANEC